MGGLWLDAGTDYIADQAVHRGRNPGVVAGVPFGPVRRRSRARQNRRVQAVDGPGALPAAAATGGVEGAGVAKAEKSSKESPHAADYRAPAKPWILGEFGKRWVEPVPRGKGC